MTPAFILAVLGGLIFGSFLNVLLWRLPEGEGIGGRSRCRSCNTTLAWYDLIPVLSFAALRGRCRTCKNSIHIRYPLIELSVAAILGAYFYARGPMLDLDSFVMAGTLLVLISLFYFDLLYFILPDTIVLPAIGFYLVYDLLRFSDPVPYVLTGLLAAAFFAILYAVSRGKKLGFGDVKLVLLLGLIFGYPLGFMVIVLGIWLAALVSIILLITGRALRTDPVPLGAFLVLASILEIIFYHEFIPFTSLFL